MDFNSSLVTSKLVLGAAGNFQVRKVTFGSFLSRLYLPPYPNCRTRHLPTPPPIYPHLLAPPQLPPLAHLPCPPTRAYISPSIYPRPVSYHPPRQPTTSNRQVGLLFSKRYSSIRHLIFCLYCFLFRQNTGSFCLIFLSYRL